MLRDGQLCVSCSPMLRDGQLCVSCSRCCNGCPRPLLDLVYMLWSHLHTLPVALPPYCTGISKALETSYTRVLAAQLQDKGIMVNACCPGSVRLSLLVLTLMCWCWCAGGAVVAVQPCFIADDSRVYRVFGPCSPWLSA